MIEGALLRSIINCLAIALISRSRGNFSSPRGYWRPLCHCQTDPRTRSYCHSRRNWCISSPFGIANRRRYRSCRQWYRYGCYSWRLSSQQAHTNCSSDWLVQGQHGFLRYKWCLYLRWSWRCNDLGDYMVGVARHDDHCAFALLQVSEGLVTMRINDMCSYAFQGKSPLSSRESPLSLSLAGSGTQLSHTSLIPLMVTPALTTSRKWFQLSLLICSWQITRTSFHRLE